jgi:tetratricopeptide (TPR) repeat protein
MGLELDDRFPALHLYRAWALEAQGVFDESQRAFETAIELSGNAIRARAGLAHLLGRRGQHESARAMLQEISAESGKHYLSRYPLALVHVGLGEHDSAFGQLEQAFNERCESLVWLRVDPRLAALRDDSRFRALEQRLSDEGASSEGRDVLSQTIDFGSG